MELELEREALDGYETLAEVTLCQEETQETIVPDACPDILRIVEVCGQAVLTGRQAKEGSGTVTGAVQLTLLYQPEGGGRLCRMEAEVPFTRQAEVDGLTAQGHILAGVRLKRAEARALNPRKVLLRVEPVVELTACQPMHREICRGVSGEEAVCQRQTGCECCYLADVEEKPFICEEQIRLKEEESRFMWGRVRPICTESKRIGNKLIFKGNAEVSLLLLEESGEWTVCRETLPFSQVLELMDGGEDGECRVAVELCSFRCTPDPDDRQCMEVEMELLAQAQIYRRRTVTVLRDLYSTTHLTECVTETDRFSRWGELSVLPQGVRELIEAGEGLHSVVDSALCLGEIMQQREERALSFTVEARVTVLYLDENDQLRCAEGTIPVTARMTCQEDTRCSCRCLCTGEVYAAPAAGGIEVRFNLEFHCLTMGTEAVTVISSAKLGEERDSGGEGRPSVVLRLASSGEDLWEIAKAYGTTMERIIQANELENEELPLGTMLLIPSTR